MNLLVTVYLIYDILDMFSIYKIFIDFFASLCKMDLSKLILGHYYSELVLSNFYLLFYFQVTCTCTCRIMERTASAFRIVPISRSSETCRVCS